MPDTSRIAFLPALSALTLLLTACETVSEPFDDGKEWSDPVIVSDSTATSSPTLAINADGEAAIAWQSRGNNIVSGSSCVFTIRWASAQWGDIWIPRGDIDDATGVCPQEVNLAVDNQGDAVFVFSRGDLAAPRSDLVSRQFSRDSGWMGPAEPLEFVDEQPVLPAAFAIDGSGNAIAVWPQFDGERFNLVFNERTDEGAWRAETGAIEDGNGDTRDPSLAVTPDGRSIVAWRQTAPSRREAIWASLRSSGGEWSTPRLLDDETLGNSQAPLVAIDEAGNAMVVWQQETLEQRTDLWSRYFDARGDADWEPRELVEVNDESVIEEASVVLGADGEALVSWLQSDGNGPAAWANRKAVGGSWERAVRLGPGDTISGGGPQLAVAADGEALVVWESSENGASSVLFSRYRPTAGWGRTGTIRSGITALGPGPRIAMSPDGRAVAAWNEGALDGASLFGGVAVSRFGPTSPSLTNGE